MKKLTTLIITVFLILWAILTVYLLYYRIFVSHLGMDLVTGSTEIYRITSPDGTKDIIWMRQTSWAMNPAIYHMYIENKGATPQPYTQRLVASRIQHIKFNWKTNQLIDIYYNADIDGFRNHCDFEYGTPTIMLRLYDTSVIDTLNKK